VLLLPTQHPPPAPGQQVPAQQAPPSQQVAALSTRKVKDIVPPRSHLFRDWQAEVKDHAFGPDAVKQLINRTPLSRTQTETFANFSKGSKPRPKHFFVLVATAGRHEFFETEKGVRDLREHPIRFAGYSISYRRGVDRRFHVSVRIAPDEYLRLKAYFVDLACHRSVDGLAAEFSRLCSQSLTLFASQI